MKKFIKYLKGLNKESGNSLSEFAVTTAMMATLATTAAPKFSGVGEGAKEKKTLSDIDKIITASNNFYNDRVSQDGRGRFPGQNKFDEAVPEGAAHDYTPTLNGNEQIEAELGVKAQLGMGDNAQNWSNSIAQNWASIFGTSTTNAKGELIIPSNTGVSSSEDVETATNSDGVTIAYDSYADWAASGSFDNIEGVGALEYLELFGGNPIKSPFQDGHYIYLVIEGNGSGSASVSPILFVADLESPRDFWKKLQP
jgi:hypothetical protein